MNREIALVIMAAGIGSRFGERIKQLEPIGTGGELMLEYAAYDAAKAGFDRIVLIIRRDIEQLVREKIGNRFSGSIKVSYVFQEKDDLPVRRELAVLRKKPWGTGQAVLAARSLGLERFAVINADDFYGAEAYRSAYEYLSGSDNTGKSVPEYAMCGFLIQNTLSGSGTVTRGICTVKDGFLKELEETKELCRGSDGVIRGSYNGQERVIPENTPVSMNMWCFTREYMDALSSQFEDFLNHVDENDADKGEFLVPVSVDRLIKDGKCAVRVLKTDSRWFGMTYEQDVEAVKASVRECVEKGVYPPKLWE